MRIRLVALIVSAVLPATIWAGPFEEARVIETVNIVSLLHQLREPQPATVGDIIKGQTALKTGGESRAELKFPDLTITRVGSNSLFRFYAGGRDMTLDGGTMLFYSPKGAGGGKVQAGAVTAAVTGSALSVMNLTPVMKTPYIRVVCLEHTAVVSGPGFTRKIRAGQLIDQTGKVTNIDLVAFAKSSGLFNGFSTSFPVSIKNYGRTDLNLNLDTSTDQTGQVTRRTIGRGQQGAVINNQPVQSQLGSPTSFPLPVNSSSRGSSSSPPTPPTAGPSPPTAGPPPPTGGNPERPRRGNRSNIRDIENRGNSGNAPGRANR
jgi:hypothetical protein